MRMLHGAANIINPGDWRPYSSQERSYLQVIKEEENIITLSGTTELFTAIRILIKEQKKILNSLLIIKDPGTSKESIFDKELLNIAPPLGDLGKISKKEKEKIIINNKISFALTFLKSLIRVTHDYRNDNVVVQISRKAYGRVQSIPHKDIKKSIEKALKDKFVDN